jgi:hypothetical protein
MLVTKYSIQNKNVRTILLRVGEIMGRRRLEEKEVEEEEKEIVSS